MRTTHSGGPLRAFRDRYVAPFSGVSYDLAPGALGVHPDHLEQAPELAGRRVYVSSESPAARFLHPTFHVVPLTHMMRNALDVGAEGGVVFSTFDADDPVAGRLLEGLGVGDAVFINAALARLPDVTLRRPSFDSAA